MIYFPGKSVIALITFIQCSSRDDFQSCQDRIGVKRIQIMEILDAFTGPLFLFYTCCVLCKLLHITRRHSRYEYNLHKTGFILMSVTLLISQPLILLGTVFWLTDADGFEFNRWEFYVYWLSHSLPMFVFIFIKPREDCFNCFNR